MKVILIQDVENLGKKFEVKDVKKGYARNHLFNLNLAKPATEESLKWLEIQLELAEKEKAGELKKVQAMVSSIEGKEINFNVKMGDKGQLFESISSQKIKDKLQEEGFNVSKNQINLKESIKETGTFNVKINFDHNLEASIKVIVNEE